MEDKLEGGGVQNHISYGQRSPFLWLTEALGPQASTSFQTLRIKQRLELSFSMKFPMGDKESDAKIHIQSLSPCHFYSILPD